jgi:hypothetical protein
MDPDLLAELRAIASLPLSVLEGLVSASPTDFGDELKNDSYRAFVEAHPEWPMMYEYAKTNGIDPLEHWLNWIWRDETCAACGKKGHKHHPSCRCRRCF